MATMAPCYTANDGTTTVMNGATTNDEASARWGKYKETAPIHRYVIGGRRRLNDLTNDPDELPHEKSNLYYEGREGYLFGSELYIVID